MVPTSQLILTTPNMQIDFIRQVCGLQIAIALHSLDVVKRIQNVGSTQGRTQKLN